MYASKKDAIISPSMIESDVQDKQNALKTVQQLSQ
jgi:hypothetical protein